MKLRICSALIALSVISACTQTNGSGSSGAIRNVPEAVVAIAAPNQDLSAVRVLPEDGCYWYTHRGPVETTLLPLRNKEGRPICTRPAEAAS